MSELAAKLAVMRAALARSRLGAIRLRGVDWFSWATCGGSSAVLGSAETGVAEVVVTARDAFVVTDRIEDERLATEEVPPSYTLWSHAWQDRKARNAFVREIAGGGPVASDRPGGGETELPADVVAAKRRLLTEEVERYRALGVDASRAMSEAMHAARPEWTENQLAGRLAGAFVACGIEPALAFAAGEERSVAYRHPVSRPVRVGAFAMAWCCARRQGLFANLTRWVYFRPPTRQERERHEIVAAIESAAWGASRTGVALSEVYHAIARAYERYGCAADIDRHHQGGTTGYLARELIATAETETPLAPLVALAWNPSVAGAKIEDTTILDGDDRLEILTLGADWPRREVHGFPRPDLLVRP